MTTLVGSELSEAVSTVELPQLRLAAVRAGGSAGVTIVLSDALRSVACGGMWYSRLAIGDLLRAGGAICSLRALIVD